MKRLSLFVIVCGIICNAAIANASSPTAWAELYAKANAACIAAANLNGAVARGEPIDFEDLVLVIVDGRQPQPHMKNAKSTKYCIYRKQSGKVDVSEAPAAVPVASATATATATGRTCWTASFRAQLKVPRAIGAACTAKNDEGDSYTGVVQK
jgi:hypothetical protein